MRKRNLWEDFGFGPGWEEQEAVFRWKEIVGESLAPLARPLHVEGGVLHLAVVSPVVATELRLWQEALLQRLKEAAPKSAVRELKFHLDPASQAELPAAEAGVTDLERAEEMVPEDLLPGLREIAVRVVARALAQEKMILRLGGQRCSRCGIAFLGKDERCPLCRLHP